MTLPESKIDVAVIGAGIIGVCTALELAERDNEALRDAGLGERHAAVAGLSLGGIAVDFSHAHRTGHQASRIRQRHNFSAA